jgi:hypothetical protein
MGLKYKICEIVKAEQANCLYLAVGEEEKKKKQLTIQFTNVNINAETTDRNGRKNSLRNVYGYILKYQNKISKN